MFSERERVALRYAEVVTWDPAQADDALWARLHASFTEPEIMEIGRFISLLAGGIRWVHTIEVEHKQIEADGDVGLAPKLRGAASGSNASS